MSPGWPMRPSGACASNCLRKSLSLAASPADEVPSVSTMPGLIELTRILRGPSSLASDRVTGRLGGAVDGSPRRGRRGDERADVDDAAAARAEVPGRLL